MRHAAEWEDLATFSSLAVALGKVNLLRFEPAGSCHFCEEQTIMKNVPGSVVSTKMRSQNLDKNTELNAHETS